MRVTEHIHAIRIPFTIPVGPGNEITREVYAYIVFGDGISLVDSGVAGSETIFSDYIKKNGRDPKEIRNVILTHSHPDHIGAARAIQQATGCSVLAHGGEKEWIEDTERQFRERPVPGFHTLVGGPVTVDSVLADGDVVDLGASVRCEVMHTPGHSRGSITLVFGNEKTIISGDCLPLPNDLPIYENSSVSVNSINRLKRMKHIEVLLSSWEAPIHGYTHIEKRIDEGLSWLRRIHETVLKEQNRSKSDVMELCRNVVRELGLPLFAANSLVARAFASSLESPEIM
jgi:hydroxyacylglutathione hydrolase